MIRFVVDGLVKVLLHLTVRVRATGLDRIPFRGPAIIAVNHINFLEIPLLYTLLKPRRVIALVKSETWDSSFARILGNLWGGIPIQRGRVDRNAFELAKREALAGAIVGMAPEGTRSRDGKLRKGSPGIILLSETIGTPIIPVVHYGGESYFRCLRRFRRALVRIKVGRPFVVSTWTNPGETAQRLRRRETERLMGEIASLLPEDYRGCYAAPGSTVTAHAPGDSLTPGSAGRQPPGR